MKVPLAIEEADPHHGQREVARGFQDVARQDAQATRVDREVLGEPELRRKIGDALVALPERQRGAVRGLRPVLEPELGGLTADT